MPVRINRILLIEPVWNRNDKKYDIIYADPLLIEPVWNRN